MKSKVKEIIRRYGEQGTSGDWTISSAHSFLSKFYANGYAKGAGGCTLYLANTELEDDDLVIQPPKKRRKGTCDKTPHQHLMEKREKDILSNKKVHVEQAISPVEQATTPVVVEQPIISFSAVGLSDDNILEDISDNLNVLSSSPILQPGVDICFPSMYPTKYWWEGLDASCVRHSDISVAVPQNQQHGKNENEKKQIDGHGKEHEHDLEHEVSQLKGLSDLSMDVSLEHEHDLEHEVSQLKGLSDLSMDVSHLNQQHGKEHEHDHEVSQLKELRQNQNEGNNDQNGKGNQANELEKHENEHERDGGCNKEQQENEVNETERVHDPEVNEKDNSDQINDVSQQAHEEDAYFSLEDEDEDEDDVSQPHEDVSQQAHEEQKSNAVKQFNRRTIKKKVYADYQYGKNRTKDITSRKDLAKHVRIVGGKASKECAGRKTRSSKITEALKEVDDDPIILQCDGRWSTSKTCYNVVGKTWVEDQMWAKEFEGLGQRIVLPLTFLTWCLDNKWEDVKKFAASSSKEIHALHPNITDDSIFSVFIPVPSKCNHWWALIFNISSCKLWVLDSLNCEPHQLWRKEIDLLAKAFDIWASNLHSSWRKGEVVTWERHNLDIVKQPDGLSCGIHMI